MWSWLVWVSVVSGGPAGGWMVWVVHPFTQRVSGGATEAGGLHSPGSLRAAQLPMRLPRHGPSSRPLPTQLGSFQPVHFRTRALPLQQLVTPEPASIERAEPRDLTRLVSEVPSTSRPQHPGPAAQAVRVRGWAGLDSVYRQGMGLPCGHTRSSHAKPPGLTRAPTYRMAPVPATAGFASLGSP